MLWKLNLSIELDYKDKETKERFEVWKANFKERFIYMDRFKEYREKVEPEIILPIKYMKI